MTLTRLRQHLMKMFFLVWISMLVACSPYTTPSQSSSAETPFAIDMLPATPTHSELRPVISLENANKLTPLLIWQARITNAAWSPNKNCIGISTISDTGEYGVYVLDVNELLFTQYIQDASGKIVFNLDENLIISEDGVINVWEINTGEKLRSYGGNAERWVFLHSETTILVVQSFPPSFDKIRIGLWNTMTGELTDKLEINGILRGISYNHGLSFLALSMIEKPDKYRIAVWDINLEKQICDIPDARFAEFDKVNDLLVVTKGKEFSFWDVRKCEIRRKIITDFETKYSFALSPDGNLLAFDNGSGGISIIDAEDGARITELKSPKFNTNKIFFNPDGNILLTISNDDFTTTQTLALWQVNYPSLELLIIPSETTPILKNPLSP